MMNLLKHISKFNHFKNHHSSINCLTPPVSSRLPFYFDETQRSESLGAATPIDGVGKTRSEGGN